MKHSYLIVKTGRSGAKIADLYDTEITTESGQRVRLAGDVRLVGGWFRAITKAVKNTGITGTLSVFQHTTDTADELVRESQRTLLMLSADINWQVVARIDASESELAAAADQGRQQVWHTLLSQNRIQGTLDKQGRVKSWRVNDSADNRKNMPYLAYRQWLKQAKADIKRRVDAGGAQAVAKLIKYVE